MIAVACGRRFGCALDCLFLLLFLRRRRSLPDLRLRRASGRVLANTGVGGHNIYLRVHQFFGRTLSCCLLLRYRCGLPLLWLSSAGGRFLV